MLWNGLLNSKSGCFIGFTCGQNTRLSLPKHTGSLMPLPKESDEFEKKRKKYTHASPEEGMKK